MPFSFDILPDGANRRFQDSNLQLAFTNSDWASGDFTNWTETDSGTNVNVVSNALQVTGNGSINANGVVSQIIGENYDFVEFTFSLDTVTTAGGNPICTFTIQDTGSALTANGIGVQIVSGGRIDGYPQAKNINARTIVAATTYTMRFYTEIHDGERSALQVTIQGGAFTDETTVEQVGGDAEDISATSRFQVNMRVSDVVLTMDNLRTGDVDVSVGGSRGKWK